MTMIHYHRNLTKVKFLQLKSAIDQLTPDHVQVYVVAWTYPYRVALAVRYDEFYCSQRRGRDNL